MFLAVRHFRLSLCVILLAAFGLPSNAQSFIHKYVNNIDNQYYNMARSLRDGRIVAGGSASVVNDRALATMLDAEGNILWNRVYVGAASLSPWGIADLVETADGNLLALINVTDADNTYTNLVNISSQTGAIQQALRFGDDTQYAVYNHIARGTDGFIMTGAVGATAQPTGFSLMKTDFNGAILWQRTVQNSNVFGSLRASAVAENGHIWAIADLQDNLGGAIGKVALLHFNEAGNLLATYECRASNAQRKLYGISIAWQPGTGPVLGCYYYLTGPSSVQPLIAQLDTLGNVKWSKVINTTPDTYTTPFVSRLPDGNLIAACGSGGVPNFGLLAKLDPNGTAIWLRDLTVNEGAETLLAANIDEQGNVVGAGQALAPLPLLERKGFVFRTDDPNFEQPSCCSGALTGQTIDAALLVENLTFSAGAIVEPLPTNLSVTNEPIQRQVVCGVEQAPQVMWSDTSICPGACATLKIIPPGPQVYTLTATGASPETAQVSDSVILCFPAAGVYTITLENGDCVRTQLTYTVQQRVPGSVMLSDTVICPGKCILASSDESSATDEYFWVFEGGDPDQFNGLTPPEVCYDTAGVYAIRLNIAGCGFSEATLEVSSSPYSIPNAFTPNGDGFNDVFRPLLDCPSGAFLFEIYNRWGQKVFTSDNPDMGWDGRHNDEAAVSDVYVWVLSFGEIDASGVVVSKKEKGEVTLLR